MRSGLGRSWMATLAVALLSGCGGSSGSSGTGTAGTDMPGSGGAGGALVDGGTAGRDAKATGAGGSIIIVPPDTGSTTCVPPTCAELGANCGAVTDRKCGGVVDCGTCATGVCGAGGPNVCGTGSGGDASTDGSSGSCVAKTCADLGANCGPVSDTCGGLLQCGSCEAGTACGVGGTPNVCSTGSTGDGGGGTCIPRSCANQGLFCGPAGDGCGNTLSCGTCTGTASCGGGGTPGVCGSPACTPLTCASQSVACGPAGDGCGGTLSCGTCASPQTCGGGGMPGQCGCTGLCSQVPTCTGSTTTTLTGKVYDPAGTNPLYHVLVYVPNDPSDPALHSFTQGITCDQCGASAAGKPLVTTYTATDGSFTLSNVPVGANIPVVIQLGRWRRIFSVNINNSCAANPVTDRTLKMPSDHTEGDIPLIAMVTGDVDEIECVFRKMGIKDSEFTNPSAQTDGGTTGGGRIHVYLGTDQNNNTQVQSGTANVTCNGNNDCGTGGCNNGRCVCARASDCATGQTCSGNGRCQAATFDYYSGQYIDANTPKQNSLFSTVNGVPVINQYDMTILACEGHAITRTAGQLTALRNYANSGGRVFASHFSYGWIETNGDYAGTANWQHNTNDEPASGTGVIDLASNPKGGDFKSWLEAVGASTPGSGTVPVVVLRHDTSSVIAPTQQWLYRQGGTAVPLHFTFNTPPSAASGAQCGRVLFSDFHVHDASNNHLQQFPQACDTGAMTAQEKLLEFMIFDLGSCVTPYTPVCTPITCTSQGIQCGPAGNGCGGELDCGTCPSGQICGGGGSGKCGAPQCTPRTCADQGLQCGPAGDGCGHALDCGTCPAGLTCGGGGHPGICGNNPVCTPVSCSTQSIQCGPAGDGCGNAIDCGTCPTGQTCGAGGPGKCGSPECTPTTCTAQGIECGPAGDGCGNLIECGVCPTGDTCGFNAPGKCGHLQVN
jgi:hypothetical protein